MPIAYDRAKSGPDAFKIGTWSAKIGKEFKTSLAGFLQVGSAKLDAVLKVKVSGTAEIGPDYAKALAAIGKQLPESVAKAFLEKAAPEIAKDEARTFTQQLMKEVVESETAHIADEAVRKQVQKHAEAELAEHIAKKELELELAKKSSFFIQRELMEEASKELSVVAIRAKASSIVAREAIPLVTQLRPAITLMVRQAAKRISLKAMAKNAAKALIPGPADMVLVVPEILYHLFDTLMKDYELKRVGLMASECRDNYVGGYTEALRAKTVGGATTGGAGNLQGTSYALGLTDGAKQLDAVLATFLGQQPDATPEEARAEVGEVMQGTAIDRTAIVAAAQPKLRDILLKSYEKQFSGGVARWLFGDGDFKESKQYDAFLREIDHHLSPSPDKYEVANLANGVKVTLVPLEGIDIRNKWFRTLDGKHSNVSIGGDTSTHSGWITEDGRPLEDVYPSQDAADATGTDEAAKKRDETLRGQLRAGAVTVKGSFSGFRFAITSASISGVPSELDFQEFLRSPTVQGMTLRQAGVGIDVDGRQRWSKELHDGLDEDAEIEFEARVTGVVISLVVTDDDGHPELVTAQWKRDVGAAMSDHVAGARFAQLPQLW